jgi:Na+/proline symporter
MPGRDSAPRLALSFSSKKVNKFGAWAGILVGGILAGIWPYLAEFFKTEFQLDIPAILVGFLFSLISIIIVSHFTRNHHYHAKETTHSHHK